ncbi:fimbria/pilus outer membrane usher protein [Pseudacidovorax intermedius]|uniref:PapC N-terminal domain-containing protein n=1 Tax=Pseudacidovorax intermedius TaxID=433924 RepID=A0A147GSD8_9BURK|nr:fimbria/pilus outer membrane usher protein [Pseudacidovorax intermedius]KTT20548.1 hypothetical protein NS331_13795 [Pseudacidovorax intermedius]
MAQFDTELLRERGLSPRIAEYFRNGPRFQPGAQPVTFTVNGNELGRKSATFDAVGKLCFTPALLRSLGLKSYEQFALEKPNLKVDAEVACPDYRDVSPRTLIVLRPNEGAVDLTVPAEDVVPVARSLRTETGGIGALFNYRGYAYESQWAGGYKSTSRYLDTELGFNAADWIVRSRQMYSEGDGVGRFRWQSAYAQRTFVDEKQVLQAGRITTINPLYSGLPITGAQWFPERGLRQMQSYPITGVASTRARVEIRQNGVLLYSTVVPPGPFTLTDYPLTNKGADLQVRVIEETGSEQIITVPASSLLLASDNTQNAGLTIAAGQLWDQTDVRTYDRVPVLTGAYGWALGPVSGTVGGLVSRSYTSAGVAANWKFAENASAFGQVLASRDGRRDANGAQGSAAVAWQASKDVSLGVSGNLRTVGYRTVQDAASIYQAPIVGIGARSQLGATASWSLGRFGSVSAGITRETYFDGEPGHIYSLAWGTSWQRVNFQLGVSRNTARTYLVDPRQPWAGWVLQQPNTYVYANLSIPLGSNATSTTYARRSNDVTRYGTGIDQRINDMLSYRVSAERADDGRGTEASGSITVVPRYTSLTLGVSDRQGGSSYYGEITGSVLATPMGVGFSPYAVADTFGGINTGNVVGLKVDTPQGPVWSGPGGFAAVPSLLAYQDSRLEASLKDASLDVDVDNPLQVVQAGRGAVLSVDFGAKRVRRVLLEVRDADGQLVPSGLAVLRGGDEFFSSTAQGGRVMVSRMVDGDMFYVELPSGKRCLVQDIETSPKKDGELFESGKAVCK